MEKITFGKSILNGVADSFRNIMGIAAVLVTPVILTGVTEAATLGIFLAWFVFSYWVAAVFVTLIALLISALYQSVVAYL